MNTNKERDQETDQCFSLEEKEKKKGNYTKEEVAVPSEDDKGIIVGHLDRCHSHTRM